MAARAIYKANLIVKDQRIPVKLYSAIEDRSIHFRLLHSSDLVPLQQRMIDPKSDKPVSTEEIQRGYQADTGQYVIVSQQELQQLEPAPSRDIEVLRFVPPEQLNHQWYSRPYYLGPDGSTEAYFALVEALAAEAREGICRWVMRKSEYRGALRVHDDYLALVALRHAEEVIDTRDLSVPGGRELDAKELSLAENLVGLLSGDFDPASFSDEYRERVLELVARKVQGKPIELKRPLRKKKTDELYDVLKASVKNVKERKVA